MSPLDQIARTETTEAAILTRVVGAGPAGLAPEAARALLNLRFPDGDMKWMKDLTARAGEGVLTPEEQRELANYRHVGHLLDLLWSIARLSLRQAMVDRP